jgi:ATP-dependent Clp protease ATP-binding subunit ClpA
MAETQFNKAIGDIITMSREVALNLSFDYIGIEHVLLAIARYTRTGANLLPAYISNDDPSAKLLFKYLGIHSLSLEKELQKIVGHGNADLERANSLPLTKNLERVLQEASLEAELISSSEVNVGALILSILKQIEGHPKKIQKTLKAFKLEYDVVLLAIITLARRAKFVGSSEIPKPSDSLSLYFDLEEFDAHSISEIIYELSALYASIGGDQLEIKGMENLEYIKASLPA